MRDLDLYLFIVVITAGFGELLLYDYLPNGVVRQYTRIVPGVYDIDPGSFDQTVISFSGDKETFSLIPFSTRKKESVVSTNITDPAHKSFLNNMLH